jgi:hypothetical protein
LASLQSTIARQCSWVTFLAEGNANTQFFHLQACHRERKNFISELKHHDEIVVDEERKSQLVFDHFNAILGDFEDRDHGLDFARLGLPVREFMSIDSYFSESDVWSATS